MCKCAYVIIIRTCSTDNLYGPDTFPECCHCTAHQTKIVVSCSNMLGYYFLAYMLNGGWLTVFVDMVSQRPGLGKEREKTIQAGVDVASIY